MYGRTAICRGVAMIVYSVIESSDGSYQGRKLNRQRGRVSIGKKLQPCCRTIIIDLYLKSVLRLGDCTNRINQQMIRVCSGDSKSLRTEKGADGCLALR